MTLEEIAESLSRDTMNYLSEPKRDSLPTLTTTQWHFSGNGEALRDEIVDAIIGSRFGLDEYLGDGFSRMVLTYEDAGDLVDHYTDRLVAIINNPNLRSPFANPEDAKWLNEHREDFKPDQAGDQVLVEGTDEEWQAWMEEVNKNTPENRKKAELSRQLEQDLRGKNYDERQLPYRLEELEMVPGDQTHELLKEHLTFNQYTRVMNRFFDLMDQAKE